MGAVDRNRSAMTMAEQWELVSRRRFIRGALVGAGLVTAGPTLWRRPGYAAEAPGARHLTFGTDPTRDMSVSWSTSGPVQNAVLDLGTDTAYGTVVPAETRAITDTATVYHHARLSGLTPGTTYHYRVRHDGGATEDATFRTAPTDPAPFTFTAFGDQGVSDGAKAITARLAALSPAFHIHAGDICYANNRGFGKPAEFNHPDNNVWDTWLAMMTAVGATAPWMTAVGNHEMEGGYGEQGYDGYLGRFTLPANGPTVAPVVYSFRYGNVAFVSLDANDVSYEITANTGYTEGAQDQWLRSRLASLRGDPDIDFIVVQFHHCAYCTNAVHASDGGVRDHWEKIFDEFAVDLVVNGHNHSYERTVPMRGGEPSEQGTVYITAGGGGQVAYQASPHPLSYVTIDGGLRMPEAAPWSAVRYLDLSLLAVDVTPPGADGRTTMAVRAMAPDGTVVDSFTLARQRAVNAPATAAPAAAAQPTAAPAAGGGRLAATGASGVAALGAAAAVVAAASRAVQRKIDDR